jgi:TonB family protein
MHRVRWKILLLVLSLAVVPVYGDEDVDLLIAYILAELESSQTACNEIESAKHAGKRVVCGNYDESFSALKSDWDLILRHTLLPLPISTKDAWTYRDGSFRITYRHGSDRELQVNYHPEQETLLFAYTEADVDPFAANKRTANGGPLDLGENPPPRMAGFGGVSIPTVIKASRVEPLRSLRARVELVAGAVTLEIVVQRDGTVRDVVVLRVAPDGYEFGLSALEAVRQWRFEPALFEGQPIDAVINLTVEVKQDPPPDATVEHVE